MNKRSSEKFFYYKEEEMKYLLLLTLIFIMACIPACDQDISTEADPRIYGYCEANFIPSDWNTEYCSEHFNSTCCLRQYDNEPEYDQTSYKEVEWCYNHSTCRWNPVSSNHYY